MFSRENFTFTAERFVAAAREAFAQLVRAVDAVLPHADADERGLLVDLAWSVVHGFATLVNGGQIFREAPDPAAIDERATAVLNAWFRDAVRQSQMAAPADRRRKRTS
jgi:hypothetical protein